MAWFFRHDSCTEAQRQLADRLGTLEVTVATLRLEVLDTLEKVTNKLAGRLAKREAREAGETKALPGVDPISAAIIARRKSNGVRPVIQP